MKNIRLNIFRVIIVAAIVVPAVLFTRPVQSTNNEKQFSSFYVVPLGSKGGLDESDISCYLLTSVLDNGQPDSKFITLDGGTLRHGIKSVSFLSFTIRGFDLLVSVSIN